MKCVCAIAGAAAFGAGLAMASAAAAAEVSLDVEAGVNVWRPAAVQAAPAPVQQTYRRHGKKRAKVVIDAVELIRLNAGIEDYRRAVVPGYPFDTHLYSGPRYPF